MNKSALIAALSSAYEEANRVIDASGYDDEDLYDSLSESDFIELMTGPAQDVIDAFTGYGRYYRQCAGAYLEAIGQDGTMMLEQCDLVALATKCILGDSIKYFEGWQDSMFAGVITYQELVDFIISRARSVVASHDLYTVDYPEMYAYALSLFYSYDYDTVDQDTMLAAMRYERDALDELEAHLLEILE